MEANHLTEFFQSDACNSLDDGSKALLMEFTDKISGKSPSDAMIVLMEYRDKLSAAGKIDRPAQSLLMSALEASLSADGKKRFEALKGIMRFYE